SDYSLPQANLLSSSASGIFSFCQTGQADLSGPTWDATAEGPQNFHDFSDHGDMYHGDPEDLVMPFGQMTPKRDPSENLDDSHLRWPVMEANAPKSEPMRRITSRSSTASSKHRPSKASSKKTQSRVQSILAQTSAQIPNLDLTGNAPTYHESSMGASRMMDVPHYLATQDLEALSVSSQVTASPFYSSMVAMNADGLHYPADLGGALAQQHVNPQVFEAMPAGSPQSWASLSPVGSRFSSPQAPDCIPDDTWSTIPPESSPPESYIDSSPPMGPNQSPRYVGLSHLVALYRTASQLGASEESHGMAITGDDALILRQAFSSRRSSGEGESARDHYLYKNACPQADNLFHCPWEGQPNCSHKPEKLKCNYDKFVDSHLKPYRCKHEGCQNTRFSSTACLLRHEREAHAMHGHGEKPYLCTYEGCDRAVPGHGFPRQWNLRDHMRRVHNDNGTSTQATTSPPASGSTPGSKGKKRKTDQEKASGDKSSHRKSGSASAKSGGTAIITSASLAHVDEIQPAMTELDQWYDHQRALQALVEGFGQPEDPQFLQSYKDAQGHLAAMGKISNNLITTKNADILQGPFRRSWKQSG
ncbi:hypothetical protein GQ53DRAFT_652953, partial [Thozetella sp. PMI_491]